MKPSRFWEYVNKSQLSMNSIEENLPKFKSSKVNFNISLHDPEAQGLRYLHTLIYVLAENMTDEMFDKLKKIQGRRKGFPIAILYKNEVVCLDYLQAIFELTFMEQYIELKGVDILEIGAGYGRTCHTIMSNHNVKSYTIADLSNCLALSYRYLAEVLDKEQFAKIAFVDVESVFLCQKFDLCICIDVFSELDIGQAEQYVKYVNEHCSYFYLKTQLCRYDVNVLKEHKIIKLHLNGIFDEINVIDDSSVKSQVPKFIETYNPGNWTCLGNSNAKPYMQYWQAMYKQ